MNINEAWKYAAQVWSEPVLPQPGYAVRAKIVNGDLHITVFGLCGTIDTMRGLEMISGEIWKAMDKQLVTYRRELGYKSDNYFWPLTIGGAKERVKFCLEMAEVEVLA